MAEITRPATMREAFEETIAYLRLSYGGLYEHYWMYLCPVSYANGVLVVSAPDERRREVCEVRHAKLLSRTLLLMTGREVQIKFVLAEGGARC